jgi:hypothetical protein
VTDREAELRHLTERLRDREAVADAFLAKSFTDRLVIVDVRDGDVPGEIRSELADYDLYGADSVYDGDGHVQSSTGQVGDATRHHFVDVRTRGDHQSYVVE